MEETKTNVVMTLSKTNTVIVGKREESKTYKLV